MTPSGDSARAAALVAVLGIAVATACTEVRPEFACDGDSACVLDGEQGRCEPSDRCSFDDDACPTGRRYGEDAGDVAGTCVAPWILQLAGPFDETPPLLALDRAGDLHVASSFADRVKVGDREAETVGGTDVLHVAASARTGRVAQVESLGSAEDDGPSGLSEWGQDAVVLTAVFNGAAQVLDVAVPQHGSLVARRGEAPWATAVPLETGETRALVVEAQTVDGAGTIVTSGDAFGGPIDLGGGIVLDEAPAGYGGFVATFTGEGAPKTAYAVAIEGGATDACATIATDGDRRFATACTGYFPDERGAIDFDSPYPILVIGSTFDGYPIPFTALPPSTAITFVGFALDGALVVGGYFQEATILPDDAATGEPVMLEAIGEADGFLARIYVDVGAEEVLFGTGEVEQFGGAESGVFPLAFEAAQDGTLHVAGTYYGTVPPFGPSAGSFDAFALSIGIDGAVATAERFGGALQDLASSVAVDANGTTYLGATFQGEIELHGRTLQSAGGTDALVFPLAN